MKVPWLTALLAPLCLSSCLVLPDLTYWNGHVNRARLAGRTRVQVLADLGPPTALRDDGSAFLYALPDNNWVLVVSAYIIGALYELDPHWDVRFVAFDAAGVVQVATPKENRSATLDRLVDELLAGAWRR